LPGKGGNGKAVPSRHFLHVKSGFGVGMIKYRIASMLYRIYTIVSIHQSKLYRIYTESRDMPRRQLEDLCPQFQGIKYKSVIIERDAREIEARVLYSFVQLQKLYRIYTGIVSYCIASYIYRLHPYFGGDITWPLLR
jgi:hypothetical protein